MTNGDNLRRIAKVGSQEQWTKEEIKAGFEYYKELYNKYPSALEIDEFPYLPSSRSIQRTFGGLVKLRKELFPDEVSDYTRGSYRSKIAGQSYLNSTSLEADMFDFLTTHFLEIAVHEHKVIRPGNVNSDFYIYLNNSTGVVIDIFYAENIRSLISVVNIKVKRYSLISQKTLLVVVGKPDIFQSDKNEKNKKKKNPPPPPLPVFFKKYFKEVAVPKIKQYSKYSK
ncbi:hypothetical protein KBB76_02735 [Candidatus Saccharibacteria bacterium]|nr:hypothetical protein [Candidatus Saccharibacteria bacterium]